VVLPVQEQGVAKEEGATNPVYPSSSTSDEKWEDEEEQDDSEDERDERLLALKPSHQRVIVEVKHVEETFERFCKYPKCGEALEKELRTICILYYNKPHHPVHKQCL
jgi:hypothetical protein